MAIPSLRISPDLGWLDMGRMLDPAFNPAVLEVPQASLVATPLPARGYFGPNYPVLEIEGANYTIPGAYIRLLTGDKMKHYYRLMTALLDGEICSVRLLLDPPPVRE